MSSSSLLSAEGQTDTETSSEQYGPRRREALGRGDVIAANAKQHLSSCQNGPYSVEARKRPQTLHAYRRKCDGASLPAMHPGRLEESSPLQEIPKVRVVLSCPPRCGLTFPRCCKVKGAGQDTGTIPLPGMGGYPDGHPKGHRLAVCAPKRCAATLGERAHCSN
jgi:hypothetical protein